MDHLRVYGRALGMLGAERAGHRAALASVAIGLVQLAEPILFGRVVDTCRGSGLFSRMVAEGGFTVPQEADS